MNPYLWAFVLYALMIAPVQVRVQVVIGHGIRWRIQMTAAGLPVYQKVKNSAGRTGKERKKKTFLLALFRRRGLTGTVLDLFRWREAEVRIHLSMQDAAAAALSCAALQQTLQTAARCVGFPLAAKVSADLRAQGSSLCFQCIADTRVGNLSAAAVRLWLAGAAGRAEKAGAEEEDDAAPH